MQGISEALGDGGTIPLLVCHHGSGDLERKLLQSLVERRVDGIICNPLADGFNRYKQVQQRGVPLVFFSDAPRGLDEISYAAWDPMDVGIIVRHFADLGHRRIAYLGIRDNRRISAARRYAFRDAAADAGIELRRNDIVLNERGQPFDDAVLQLMRQEDRPTAVFAVYDDIAVSVVNTLRNAGLRVPEDVCVGTLGDAPLARAPGFEITTVKAPIVEEGRACAECLMQMIDKPDRDPIHRLVPGGELLVGKTTARYDPFQDPAPVQPPTKPQ